MSYIEYNMLSTYVLLLLLNISSICDKRVCNVNTAPNPTQYTKFDTSNISIIKNRNRDWSEIGPT